MEEKILKNVMEKEPPVGRLQSLKLPRDLSLGLAKPKKQYTPNLNVVRNKDKTKEFLKKIDQKRKEKTNKKERHDKHDNKSRYNQATGIFSQGTAEVKRSGHFGEKSISLREGSSISNMVRPTINKNNWTVNQKAEDVVLDELLNCDIDSDDEKMAYTPLTINQELAIKKKDILNLKKEEKVNMNFLISDLPPPFDQDIYSEENPALALVKLPDSFAGKGLSDDPNIKKLFDYPLNEMLEGQIGKMVIRKSGKIEVQIGRIKYELSPENTFESKEELVAICEGHNGEKAITVLGSILNNFIMFPDYDSIMKKK